jgi:hypothetical protein
MDWNWICVKFMRCVFIISSARRWIISSVVCLMVMVVRGKTVDCEQCWFWDLDGVNASPTFREWIKAMDCDFVIMNYGFLL